MIYIKKITDVTFIFAIIILFSSCNSSKVPSNVQKNTNEIDYSKSYEIISTEFRTKTIMTVTENQRVLKTNSLPNHKTGVFPNKSNPNTISEQNITYKFPLKPVFSGKSKWVREFGVAVNGIKFEPETAEFFKCESGEIYRIEAKQNLVDLGLDANNAHVQPTGAYHYHGIPIELIMKLDQTNDLILIGYANDGFPIYYSQSAAYKPSFKLKKEKRNGEICEYNNPKQTIKKDLKNTEPDGIFVSDWEYEEGFGDLDECNGILLNGEYVYFVTMPYPYIGRCLKGNFTETRPIGPPPGMGRGEHKPPLGGPPPPRHN